MLYLLASFINCMHVIAMTVLETGANNIITLPRGGSWVGWAPNFCDRNFKSSSDPTVEFVPGGSGSTLWLHLYKAARSDFWHLGFLICQVNWLCLNGVQRVFEISKLSCRACWKTVRQSSYITDLKIWTFEQKGQASLGSFSIGAVL